MDIEVFVPGTFIAIVTQFEPPLVEYSMVKLDAVKLLLVQVIGWEEFAYQVSPPFGEITVTTGFFDRKYRI